MIGMLGESQWITFAGIMFAFAMTWLMTKLGMNKLPKDQGREFAHDGAKSAGKPRGAGFIFVMVFIISALLFIPYKVEYIIYLILVGAAMLTGFLDDCAKAPWGEYKKGFLDLIIAIMLAVTYLNFNSSTIRIECLRLEVALHPVVFGILAVILIWASINVTNCSDGVDGLSGSVSVITLLTLYVILHRKDAPREMTFMIAMFVACIVAYLWFNATPSLLMMGDAGSRAMGLFIAIAVLKTGSPVLYLLVAAVLILDGGLGLIKVSLLRFLKISIMKNVQTPLHDHVRKKWGWSNTQNVYRFVIIQLVLGMIAIYLCR